MQLKVVVEAVNNDPHRLSVGTMLALCRMKMLQRANIVPTLNLWGSLLTNLPFKENCFLIIVG